MNVYSTITQKGQVAIPKHIRDELHLKTNDRVRFSIQDGKIVAQPALKITDMLGFIEPGK